MGENIFETVYKGKVAAKTKIQVQVGGGEVKDEPGQNIISYTDSEGKGLMNINHQVIIVGESVVQVKRSTTGKVTDEGLILISQFKSEVASRGEDVYYYDNSLGTFEGTLHEAKQAFPYVDFSELRIPTEISIDRSNPEFRDIKLVSPEKMVKWHDLENNYDAEEHGGKPTTWENWADGVQSALDVAGLIPGLGEIADCVNGVISLARGNYGDAALSFAAMIPGFGMAATALKNAKKLKKAVDKAKDSRGVYDLIVKNADELEQAYVGQSKNIYKRIKQHFTGNGKLNHKFNVTGGVTHKMPDSGKYEREIYEQFIILKKYGGDITTKNSSVFHKLFNKLNPVGGRFDLKSIKGLEAFEAKALKVAKKYDLPTKFDLINFN